MKEAEGCRSIAEKLQEHLEVEAGWEQMKREAEPGCRRAGVGQSRY